MAPHPSELFPRLQLCHVTVVGTLSPFHPASTSRFRALPHRVGRLCRTVDLRVLLHNRVRCDEMAFPPNHRPMLPWASNPLEVSAAIPCNSPSGEMLAGSHPNCSRKKQLVCRSCRENFRFGYGSLQKVETFCVPRRPGELSARGQAPTRAPWRLFLVRRVCVRCHPGVAHWLTKPVNMLPFARSGRAACRQLVLTAIVRRVRPAPKRRRKR